MLDGRFSWLQRMGIHEAYHRDATNRLLHWICIPIELLATIALLSLARWGRVDLGLLAIAALGVVYVAAEPLAGLLMVGLLLALHEIAPRLSSGSTALDALLAVAAFGASFLVQTGLGHGRFEGGIDDTAKNVAELRRTGNPLPIVLVFYYHLVELLFAAGYRPALRQRMELAMREEMTRIGRAQGAAPPDP